MTFALVARLSVTMSEMILSLDTPEGTYQLGCLVPNPNNTEPQPALPVERFQTRDGSVNLNQLPKTVRQLVVMAITEGTNDLGPVAMDETPQVPTEIGAPAAASPAPDPDDFTPSTDYYRVLTLPIAGSEYARAQLGIAIELGNTPDVVRRVYKGAPAKDIAEEIEAVLNPDSEQEPQPTPSTETQDASSQ